MNDKTKQKQKGYICNVNTILRVSISDSTFWFCLSIAGASTDVNIGDNQRTAEIGSDADDSADAAAAHYGTKPGHFET